MLVPKHTAPSWQCLELDRSQTPLILLPQPSPRHTHTHTHIHTHKRTHNTPRQVTTNGEGVANTTIDLRDLPPANVTRPGDSLEVKATWIGPTREAIIVTKSIRCGAATAMLYETAPRGSPPSRLASLPSTLSLTPLLHAAAAPAAPGSPTAPCAWS